MNFYTQSMLPTYSKPAQALFTGKGGVGGKFGELENREKAAYLCEPNVTLLFSKPCGLNG